MAQKCWRKRGCPQDLKEACLFFQQGKRCSMACKFAMCENKVLIEPLDLFDVHSYKPDQDTEAIRGECLSCQVYYAFLKKNFPREQAE